MVSCPGCYSALDSHEDLKRAHGVEIKHISEFLEERLANLRFARADGSMSVTYHDPCDLGREKEVFDPPRRLLEAVFGRPVREMERSRRDSHCCGAGSGVKSGYPELSTAIASERVRQAESVGANTIVTSCPWCVQNLRDCLSPDDDRIRVVDLLELLEDSLLDQDGE
ncbi:TPA: hypothetical protein HA259_05265 [Thermoplasmata archaeon]|nr:hypothetical protein [Thermoplasmata archaeon]